MRISCPFCGDRTHAEFAYLGDAAPVRPVAADGLPAPMDHFVDYVYLRANPMGWHREYWQHTSGCRSWLIVERNVSTHAIGKISVARDEAAARIGR